jgi:ABC-type protease/lipase transport system fused ATPase/permease subunit
MDEPNANLDPEGEKSLLSAINALKKKEKNYCIDCSSFQCAEMLGPFIINA